MAAARTGDYLVRFYDRYGTPIKAMDHIDESVTASTEHAKAKLGENGSSSFTISRMIYNSLDVRTRW
jgi:ABC-type Na+ transport system ATPase subunit NatA